MGLWKIFFKFIRNFLVFFFVVALLPGLPPKTHFNFESFTIPKALDLTGPLEVNNFLDNAERLFEGQVHGPECLLKRGDEIYASIVGGEIIKISGDHITHVAKFGKPCEGDSEEEICGRPLGMAFDTIGNSLIVADAYYGIWLVDLKTGKKSELVSPNTELAGEGNRKAGIFNSVTVSTSGDIYWTDSASDFQLLDGIYTFLANPSGRLFQYNRQTKQNTVLLDKLFFANGVALSPDENFIVVAETAASRLIKYHLKGIKAHQSEAFIDRLPGMPDNLTPDSDGLWVPLVMTHDSENPALHQLAAPTVLLRKFLLRCMYLIEFPFKTIESFYPNPYTQYLVHALGNFKLLAPLSPERNTILRVDWNGKIIGSLHGFDGSVTQIAHVLEDGEYLYLGSFSNDYLGRVKLPKVYKASKATSQRATTTTKATTTTTPKSTTTTTPKPVSTTTTSKPVISTTTTTSSKSPQAPKKAETPKKLETPKKVETPQKVEVPKTQQIKPKEPAPIQEEIPSDTKRPSQEKMKIIKKGGEHSEL